MLLLGRVTELRETARPIPDGPPEEAVIVGFDLSGTDEDMSVAGSKMLVVLPRVLGKRWSLGMVTRVHVEDITNGIEKPFQTVG